MNYLTKIEIDHSLAFSVGLLDNYSWHKALWSCFPMDPTANRDFLTRIDTLESGFRAWILSIKKPVCPSWCQPDLFQIKSVSDGFLEHRFYNFDLKANPTKRMRLNKQEANQRLGQRIPLVKKEDLMLWMTRKAEHSGFQLIHPETLEIGPSVEHFFKKEGNKASETVYGVHSCVHFRGTLEVVDKEKFKIAYCHGLGSAKSFGYGLLLLAPIKSM